MTYEGILRFIGLNRSVIVGGKELKDEILYFFKANNGKPAKLERSRGLFILSIDVSENRTIDCVVSEQGHVSCWTMEQNKFGGSNVNAYFELLAQSLNSRDVILEIDKNKIVLFAADDNKEINEMVYDKDGNWCSIRDDVLKEVCRPNTNDTCIFISAGAYGFSCLKFDSYMCRQLLHRFEDGQMNATRIGNCKNVGRIGYSK